ncbi:hypothetical protein NEIRO03_1100 [Nematocida sp. AWRm78]|nr:hypothetical protein NEIRO02_1323 [Nematocida sp. AWRm79]KAI5183510.1 hypothetical protein NEIRO03_1100 [Nematocida sp. AWRm78]
MDSELYYNINESAIDQSVDKRMEEYLKIASETKTKKPMIFPFSGHQMVIIPAVKDCITRSKETQLPRELENSMGVCIEYEARKSKIFKKTSSDLILLLQSNVPSPSILKSITHQLKKEVKYFLRDLSPRINEYLATKLEHISKEEAKQLATNIDITCRINLIEVSTVELGAVSNLEILLEKFAKENNIQEESLSEKMNKLYPKIPAKYNEYQMKYLMGFMLKVYKIVAGEVPISDTAANTLNQQGVTLTEVQYLEELRRFYNQVISSILGTAEYTENLVELLPQKSSRSKSKIVGYKQFKYGIFILLLIVLIVVSCWFIFHRKEFKL